jgi:hypothetical protein
MLRAWAVSRGGELIDGSHMNDLTDRVERRIGRARIRTPWHPMRSAFWIIPFAIALAAEWYWRRRRGLL